MRLILFLTFSFTAVVLFAQGPLPKAAIVLNGHTPVEYKEAVGTLHNADGVEVVRHQDPVIAFEYTSEETRIAAMQLLYTRDFSITTKSGAPVDFPLLAPYATPEQEEAYDQQKSEWIENNPDRYEEMRETMQQNQGVTVIPQEEFDEMPEEKQQHILDHPDLFTVE